MILIPDENWNITKYQVMSNEALLAYDSFMTSGRYIANRFYFKDGMVSTVFLAMDHIGGPFETAIFHFGVGSDIEARYQSIDEALVGHDKFCVGMPSFESLPKSRFKRERLRLVRMAKRLSAESRCGFEVDVTKANSVLATIAFDGDAEKFKKALNIYR